jgi:hypothetical protein
VGTRFATMLVRGEIDTYRHNRVFAAELEAGFASAGLTTKTIDYISQSDIVHRDLDDPDCLFFLCFNGFGSEINVAMGNGQLCSAFEARRKPLIDLMHDCPAHETMAHQIYATTASRYVFSTDYGYAEIAKSMGMPNVRFMPSITFPLHLAKALESSERTIDILLPIGLSNPEGASARHRKDSLRNRIYSAVFEATTARCVADLSLDPIATLRSACLAAGLALDLRTEDSRFLLTTVADYVKFERRRRILSAISHLPVTVIGDRVPDATWPRGNIRFQPATSFADLLAVMARSRIVVCPTSHATGFHERVLGAMTAKAAVVSSPNLLIDSKFIDGEEFVSFGSEKDLAQRLGELLADRSRIQAIGETGHASAMQMFSPNRLSRLVLSVLRMKSLRSAH